MKSVEEPSSLWPYSERNGVGVAGDIEALLAEPEIVLSEFEKEQAYQFAHGLFFGNLGGSLMCESPRDLESIHKTTTSADTHTFYRDYFSTENGRDDLELLGISPNASWEETEASLLNITHATINSTRGDRQEVAARNSTWRRDSLANWLKENDSRADTDFTDPEALTVDYDPEKFIKKLEDLVDYRKFYYKVQKELRQTDDSSLKQTKQILLDIHRARVNSMVAELYDSAFNFAEQSDKISSSEESQNWESRLFAALPALISVHRQETEEREESVDGFARRLDQVRNGGDWVIRDGKAEITPISRELAAFAASIDQNNEAEPVSDESIFPAEIVARLDKINWDADQLKIFNESVLSEWNLLSEHPATWKEVRARDGFAPDKKYQVVVTPEKKSLAVNSTKRVLYVPETFERSLTNESPAGALALSAHELAHVQQSYFDYELGEKLPIARIKGRRYVTVREAGGIDQERIIQREFFGRDRTVNLHYLRALEAKLGGGTVASTARAFYESYTADRQLDEAAEQKAYKLAADRSLRLYRNHGHNSQPLDYIEQALITEQLKTMDREEAEAFLVAGGSFNTRDSAALRKVGLLEMPTSLNASPAYDVMRVFERDFMQEALAGGVTR